MKIGFGFLGEAQLRKLSCVKVTEAKAFDRQNAAVPFGLYDSRMGPSEKRDGLCPTCGFDYVTCPGHLGHVELVVPVYNPLVSGLIPKLLNMQCFDCHRFKLAKLKVKTYRVRLMLVEAGLLKEESALQGVVDHAAMEARKRVGETGVRGMERAIDEVLNMHAALAEDAIQRNGGPQRVLRRTHTRTKWQKIVHEFMKACSSLGFVRQLRQGVSEGILGGIHEDIYYRERK